MHGAYSHDNDDAFRSKVDKFATEEAKKPLGSTGPEKTSLDSTNGFGIEEPQYSDGSSVIYLMFRIYMVLRLKQMLDKYWTSLYCSKFGTCLNDKGLFWAHEVQ